MGAPLVLLLWFPSLPREPRTAGCFWPGLKLKQAVTSPWQDSLLLLEPISQSARMGRHILCSCRPIPLGVTHEKQLREMKAGTGLACLDSQGAGLVGQLWLATGLVQGMWSSHQLLSHPLLSSSISAGGCDMWGLLVASTGLAGLVLDLWEVQLCYCHLSNTVPACFGCLRRGRLAN